MVPAPAHRAERDDDRQVRRQVPTRRQQGDRPGAQGDRRPGRRPPRLDAPIDRDPHRGRQDQRDQRRPPEPAGRDLGVIEIGFLLRHRPALDHRENVTHARATSQGSMNGITGPSHDALHSWQEMRKNGRRRPLRIGCRTTYAPSAFRASWATVTHPTGSRRRSSPGNSKHAQAEWCVRGSAVASGRDSWLHPDCHQGGHPLMAPARWLRSSFFPTRSSVPAAIPADLGSFAHFFSVRSMHPCIMTQGLVGSFAHLWRSRETDHPIMDLGPGFVWTIFF